ncbi:ABC transporter substrate binding protein [Desulfobacterales bacterium HSG17]|nr:ABC transporter substrate binding protein [Desulfobacterales bacterium HSG17]
MKTILHVNLILISIAFIILVSFFNGFAADKKEYPISPPEQIAKKWRIGYLEGGSHFIYQKFFIELINSLADLGWIEPIDIPPQENDEDTEALWNWLSANAKSKYLQFGADARYSNNWDKDQQKKTRKILLKKLKQDRDIDLIIAIGTWAGKDLANNEHSVPSIICISADALRAGIIKSVKDSGYDHIYAQVDTERFERQIRAFHDIIGFKRLGVAYEDSRDGRSYAGIAYIEKVADERNFEIITCHTRHETSDKTLAEASVLQCTEILAPKIDAFYIIPGNGVTSRTLPLVLNTMNAHRIPTFSQITSREVRQGVLLSVSSDIRVQAQRGAETIAKVLNGAKPRDLDQTFEEPVKILFNKATARKIGIKKDTYRLLSDMADEVYGDILPPEKITKKWRIGYLEGGSWKDYKGSLIATVRALARLGWIEPAAIPRQENNDDTAKLWAWLSLNIKSKYIEFVENAWYSSNWDKETRKNTKNILLKRLNEKGDIDLMLAMGTWAGLDLANNEHSVPTIVGSTSDPVAACIIKSPENSGYDHIHARVDPTRDERQIRAFHDVIGFKKLGVSFNDTETGRSYAAINPIKKVAGERGFELVPCYIGQTDAPEAAAETFNCTKELAPKIDSYFVYSSNNITIKNVSGILEVLAEYKIPSFSQNPDLVKSGILISVAQPNFNGVGKFYAEIIAMIINGEKPGDLNQVYEEFVKITFNADTAIKIGIKPDLFNLLSDTAEDVYGKEHRHEAETGK